MGAGEKIGETQGKKPATAARMTNRQTESYADRYAFSKRFVHECNIKADIWTCELLKIDIFELFFNNDFYLFFTNVPGI